MDEVVGLLKDPARLSELSRNIEALAIPDSAERIVNEIERQLPRRNRAAGSDRAGKMPERAVKSSCRV